MADLSTLLDYLKQLSARDTKSLLERHVKASEELGELARAILPFAGAAGTMHRFVTRNQIAEELADTLLCLYSIAQSAGISDDHLVDMVERKAQKWQTIQLGESALKDAQKVPFEIHITLAPAQGPDWSEIAYQQIETACREVGVKFTPLLLYGNEVGKEDWMTSSRFVGTVEEVEAERARIVAGLRRFQHSIAPIYEIVREKIETVPWHPAAPSIKGVVEYMPKGCYFEKHWEIPVHSDNLDQFSKFAIREGLPASRNLRKEVYDDTYLMSLTYRIDHGSREYFEAQVEQIEATIKRAGYTIVDSIAEFAILDSNVDHDSGWINNLRTAA